ncbi:hypothetical protein [Peribacillus simplex]|uniref:hypothetical protein n=1 Tax=Peribacillus simplex TaxID=1478 RepID=UPI003D2A9435
MAVWGDLKRSQVTPANRTGKGQGYFRYYRPDGSFKSIVAVNGKLILDGGDLAIKGLPDGFQNERMIEAVQWKNRLFIATGTKLVEYDGTIAKVVEPYKPKPLEALYIGLNGLSDFPDNFMEDGESANLQINGVVPNLQKGVVGQKTTFNTFISKPVEINQVEYKYEYGKRSWSTNSGDISNLKLGKDWSDSKTWGFTPTDDTDWIIQVSVRVKATDIAPAGEPEIFTIPTYKVTPYNENKAVDTNWVGTCNRIMLYWDRLIVYGDNTHASQVYISHLSNPRYFPVNNTLDFENPEQEAISKIITFRDMLIIFMPSSVQGLFGKAPDGDSPFVRHVIHTGIGCIAPETAKVMGNTVVFLSKEGVQMLKSFDFNENRMNIQELDASIKDQITADKNACGLVFDNQYHLTFPDRKERYRYYVNKGVWTKDASPYFDFGRMYEWQSELVVQSLYSGEIYQFSPGVYNDLGHIYEDRILTKSFDMGLPYNPKKIREIQIISERNNYNTELSVNVQVDDNAVVSSERITPYIEGNKVVPNISNEPNVFIDAGTVLGSWKMGVSSFSKSNTEKVVIPCSGKGRTMSVDIRNKQDSPQAILGLAVAFKVKKP